MDHKFARASRGPRSDSLRNRERLISAAREVFGEGGASLEAVARRAGVGIGTLYRHFPTRDALFQAVYRHEVEQLVVLAEQLSLTAAPDEAFRRWVHANIDMVATKRGMLAALAPSPDGAKAVFDDARAQLLATIDVLMRRAQDAGTLRADVAAEDVLRALFGICYSHDDADWQVKVTRLVDVFIDGLERRN